MARQFEIDIGGSQALLMQDWQDWPLTYKFQQVIDRRVEYWL